MRSRCRFRLTRRDRCWTACRWTRAGGCLSVVASKVSRRKTGMAGIGELMMRFSRTIFLLPLLAPLLVQGQPAPQLPPGGVAQIMIPQPVVDTTPLENISTTAMFDPPAVRPGEKTFYRITVDATQNSIDWPD